MMRLTVRQWLLVALGAGMALPFSVAAPASRTGTVPLDLIIWVPVAFALIAMGERDWLGLWRNNIARLLVAFLVVNAVSVPVGVFVYHTVDGVRSFLYMIAIVANLGVGFLVLRKLEDLRIVSQAFVASIGIVSVFLDVYLLQSGILSRVHSFHNSDVIGAVVYGWPNGFSILPVVALVLCIYLFQTATTTVARRINLGLGAALALCLLLTFSKTGWIAMAVALWLMSLRYWSWRDQLYVVAALVAIGIVLLFVTNDSFRTQVFTVETVGERFSLIGYIFRLVNPLVFIVGSGSQSLETLLAKSNGFLVPTVPLASLSAHNEYVNVLIKGGVFSLILFLAALGVAMLQTRRIALTAGGLTGQFFHTWYAAAWAVIVSMLVGEEMHYWPVAAIFWLIIGGSAHFLPKTQPVEAQERTPATARSTSPVG